MGTLARVVRNLAALVTSLVLERAISLVLFLVIARRLGPDELGEYALAFSFLAIFETLSVFGQNLLVVREVARDRTSAGRYLINSSALVSVVAVLCAALMPTVARWLGYPPQTVYYILLVGLVLIPDSLATVSESVVQAWERMEFIALFRFATNLLGAGLAIVLLNGGAGLVEVFWVLVAQRTLLAMAYGWLVWQHDVRGTRAHFELPFCRELVRVSLAFMGMSVFAALFKNVDVWILRGMSTPTEVGVYAAADRPVALVTLAAPIIMTALFPSLAETYRSAPERFERILESSLRLLAVTVPFVASLLALAAPGLVGLLYGAGYEGVVLPLQILAWSLVPTFLAALLFRVLLASNNERVSLRVSFINVVANVGLNLWLIPRGGAAAASLVALVTGFMGLVQNYWYVDRHLLHIRAGRIFAKPVAAMAVAGGLFLLLPSTWHLYVRGGLATLVYLGVLAQLRVVAREEIAVFTSLAARWGRRQRARLVEASRPAKRD